MLEEGTSTSKSTWNQNQGCSKRFCDGLVAGSSDSTTDCFGQSANLDELGCGSECCESILGDRRSDSGRYRRRSVTATAVTPSFCGSHKRLAKSDCSCSGNCRQTKQRGCGCSRGSGFVRRIWNSQNHFGLVSGCCAVVLMIVVVGFVVLGGDVRQRHCASMGEYSSDYGGYYYDCSDGFVKRERVLKIWASSSLRERRDGFIDVVSAVVQAEMPVSRGGNLNLKKWLNIPPEADVESWRRNCTIDTCVDLLACSVDDQKLGVWTEPLTAVFDEDGNAITPKPSKEFLQIRQAIQASRFNVRSADEACIVVPGFDTLSMRRFRSAKHFQMALEAGDRFHGRNVLIFTFAGTEIPAGKSIVARAQSHSAVLSKSNAGSSSSSFRRGFDVVIPFWLPPDLLDVEKMSSRGGAEVVAGLAGKGDLPGQVFTMRESGGVSGERLNGQNEKSRATGRNSGKSKGYRLAVVVSYAPEDVRRELESKLRLEVDGKGSVAREIEIVWLDRCEKVDSAIDSGKVDGFGVGVEDGKRSKRKICEIPADLGRNKGKGKGKLRGVDPMERRGRADGNHHEGSGRILKSTDGSAKNNRLESAEASWSTLDAALRMCDFALIDDRIPSHELTLVSALKAGSIPVILSDSMVLPFDELIQWPRISLSLYHSRASAVLGVVRRIEEERVGRMRREIGQVYNEYFASLRDITTKTLEILEKRILPNKIKTPSALGETRKKMESPALFLPRNVPAGTGFTAVIEAHQVESLFALIRLMVKVPSLAAIIVVWSRGSDGLREIPPVSEWPHTSRPIRVIETRSNPSDGRFVAFPEMRTECVLSLEDGDVHWLSADRIEFAFEVWRENPERLVGFMHKNGFSFNETLASYIFIGKNVRAEGGEQQKVNIKKNMNRSMALGDGDGAVFYHKYYGILYGKELWRKWGRYGESAVPQQHFGQTATGISTNSLGGKCALAVSDRKTVVYS